ELGGPSLGDSRVAHSEEPGGYRLDQEDPPAVWRVRRRTCKQRMPPRHRNSVVRPDVARHGDGPKEALRGVADDSRCASHARVVWITSVGPDRSGHTKVFL